MAIKYLAIFTLLFIAVAQAAPPNVTLVAPASGNISTLSNVTFNCSASGDRNIYNISLYTNINGTFGLYDKKKIMELENDANTTLLCHFNGNYACEGGEAGQNISTG